MGNCLRSNRYSADIWASLYKMKPELSKGEISDELQVNKSFMEKIMNDDLVWKLSKFYSIG